MKKNKQDKSIIKSRKRILPVRFKDRASVVKAIIQPFVPKPKRVFLRKHVRVGQNRMAFKKIKTHVGGQIVRGASAALLAGVLGFLGYNQFQAYVFNSKPPEKNPFTSDQVFDNNGNDMQVGDGDQFVFDTMTPEEKSVLANQIQSLLLTDANFCSNEEIDQIKEIVSISVLPYNLCDEDNEFDKNYLSFLFKDGSGKLHTLNYLTGDDFEITAELSKDTLVDFMDYLTYKCAPDTCTASSELSEKIKAMFNDADFVGDAYLGYSASGDEFYYVPVFNKSGEGIIYSAIASQVDAEKLLSGKSEMELFYDELVAGNSQLFQQTSTFSGNEILSKVLNLYNYVTGKTEDSSDKTESEEQENTKEQSSQKEATLNI